MKAKNTIHPIEREAYLSRLEAKCFNAVFHLQSLSDRLAEGKEYGIEMNQAILPMCADELKIEATHLIEAIKMIHLRAQRLRKDMEYNRRKTGNS